MKGYMKMVDKMPAITFSMRFQERLIKSATERYGAIIPNDSGKLYELAKEVLETLKPTEPSGGPKT